jgi:hypothetical protein
MHWHRGIVFLAITFSFCHAAEARVIDRYHLGPQSATTDVSTPAPNNDNVITASANQITFAAGYVGSTFGSLAPLDVVFIDHGSMGSTEYFFSDTVTNNSGVNWSAFKLQIGFGYDADFVAPNPAIVPPTPIAPDFDADDRSPSPTAPPFTTLFSPTLYELDWSGALFPGGSSQTFTFSIDTPDGSYSGFTIRQLPVPVPEPATLLLAFTALLTISTKVWLDVHFDSDNKVAAAEITGG